MNAVMLAGGFGTRLAEHTELRPKPMIEIGGRPILWHIMKHYRHFGFCNFYVPLGYKGEVIKSYFLQYYSIMGSVTVDLANGGANFHDAEREDWMVHMIDTGLHTNTGGRIKRLQCYLQHETFMLTYGDGLSDVDLCDVLRFHRAKGVLATVTAVRPPARFGGLVFDGDLVCEFTEKPQIGDGWINGGFMVLEPGIFDYLTDDNTNLEVDVLERLAADRQLAAYQHRGFWQCIDTLRDLRTAESHWDSGDAPWRVWV